MIATILPSSTSFHAVEYNERKVTKGVAELLEMRNFDSIMPIAIPQSSSRTFLPSIQQLTKTFAKHSSTSPSPVGGMSTVRNNCWT